MNIRYFIVLLLATEVFAQPEQPSEPPLVDVEEVEKAEEPVAVEEEPEVPKLAMPKVESGAAKAAPTATTIAIGGGPAEEPAKVSGESGFMDVRLNFTLTNENLFAKPGETIPSVPGWRFGRPNSLGTLFFDNYDTRFSGYETLSHAVLYRHYEKEHLEVEGALVLRVDDLAENEISLSDAGSYLRVAYWLNGSSRNETDPRISLTAFPTSSNRMRLGYSYRLSWGGSEEYQRSKHAVPGLKVQYDAGNYYAYVGAKSAIVLDRETAEEEAVMGFLAGAGIDFTDMVRLEVNGGFFNRGGNELQDVIDEDVQLFGISTQLAIHDGMPVGSSIDYKLYRNDPLRVDRLFRKTEYPGGLSWLAASEFTYLGQTLKDPAVTGGTTIQNALAGDVNVRVKYNRTRFRLDLQYRDLAYILHSTPSLPTFSDFPDSYEKTGNLFAAVGVDHNWNDSLTLGVVAGVDLPATLTTPTGVPGDTSGATGESTAVVRGEGDITILPQGEEAAAQFALKTTARVDFGEFFAGILDVYYSYDPNQTRLVRSGPDDLFMREFGEFNQLGMNLTFQAKF